MCQTEAVIYKAKVINAHGQEKTYTGFTGGSFKGRRYNHRSSFKLENVKNATRLANEKRKQQLKSNYKLNSFFFYKKRNLTTICNFCQQEN